jgi:hypothetical protein
MVQTDEELWNESWNGSQEKDESQRKLAQQKMHTAMLAVVTKLADFAGGLKAHSLTEMLRHLSDVQKDDLLTQWKNTAHLVYAHDGMTLFRSGHSYVFVNDDDDHVTYTTIDADIGPVLIEWIHKCIQDSGKNVQPACEWVWHLGDDVIAEPRQVLLSLSTMVHKGRPSVPEMKDREVEKPKVKKPKNTNSTSAKKPSKKTGKAAEKDDHPKSAKKTSKKTGKTPDTPAKVQQKQKEQARLEAVRQQPGGSNVANGGQAMGIYTKWLPHNACQELRNMAAEEPANVNVNDQIVTLVRMITDYSGGITEDDRKALNVDKTVDLTSKLSVRTWINKLKDLKHAVRVSCVVRNQTYKRKRSSNDGEPVSMPAKRAKHTQREASSGSDSEDNRDLRQSAKAKAKQKRKQQNLAQEEEEDEADNDEF